MPYDLSRVHHPMGHYMDQLSRPKYVDKYGPKKSLDHRTSPLVLLDDKNDQVTITDDKFLISLNTDGYKPEELSVKTTDQFVLIEGHHEEMSPNSQVSRSFSKKWTIPDGVIVDEIFSIVNSKNGDLLVEAPRETPEDKTADKLKLIKIYDGEKPRVHFELAEKATNNTTEKPHYNVPGI